MLTIRSLRPSYHGASTPEPQPEPVSYRPQFHSRQAKWTPEQVETLRDMWLDEKSAGQIAKAIGRSRNSVLGKVNRLGLARKEAA